MHHIKYAKKVEYSPHHTLLLLLLCCVRYCTIHPSIQIMWFPCSFLNFYLIRIISLVFVQPPPPKESSVGDLFRIYDTWYYFHIQRPLPPPSLSLETYGGIDDDEKKSNLPVDCSSSVAPLPSTYYYTCAAPTEHRQHIWYDHPARDTSAQSTQFRDRVKGLEMDWVLRVGSRRSNKALQNDEVTKKTYEVLFFPRYFLSNIRIFMRPRPSV